MRAAHVSLVRRVACKLASQAFSKEFQLELSLFGDQAEARRARWVDRSWPGHIDASREILAEILPHVLLQTYRDVPAALRGIEAAIGEAALLEAVRVHAAAVACNALSDTFVALFDGPLLGAPQPRGLASVAAPLADAVSPLVEGGPCLKS